jgi:choline kinase
MKAIILAAGVGKRLWPITQHRPKCLIELGGRTLLGRYLEALEEGGIKQISIVVGYKQDMIKAAVAAHRFSGEVRYLTNEQFRRGSITSLWIARSEMTDDVVIMDADVLFPPVMLRKLLGSSFRTALLVDESVKQQTEECMAIIRGGRVMALTKAMPSTYDFAGEGVGFLKVSHLDLEQLIGSLKGPIERGELDMEYEDALRDFFASVQVGFERIGGLPWTEIDFPEDVVRAEQTVLPKIP